MLIYRSTDIIKLCHIYKTAKKLTDPNNLFQKLILEFMDNSIEAHKCLVKRRYDGS
jgi:hypothetical protein